MGPENGCMHFQHVSTCAGDIEMKRLKKAEVHFALTVADTLLARDKLERALR